MRHYPLGVVDIVFGRLGPAESAERAAALGFDHIDLANDDGSEARFALPVVDRFSLFTPRPGRTTPAPLEGEGRWDAAVRAFLRVPGARVEPWQGSILGSIERIRAFVAEVPGVRLLLDTGHVATWGEDPAELIGLASHIQLRQARKGVAQTIDGDIDWRAFIGRLRREGYAGALSIEYFDLPDFGWPLEDPVGHALTLAEHVRPLL